MITVRCTASKIGVRQKDKMLNNRAVIETKFEAQSQILVRSSIQREHKLET